jgi:hypothetical protein
MSRNPYVPLSSKPHKSGLLSVKEVNTLLMANFPICEKTCYNWRRSPMKGFPKAIESPGSLPFYYEAEVVEWIIDYRQTRQDRQ